MTLLAIETATLTASVAVVTSDGDVAATDEREVGTHSDVLLTLIDDALRSAQMTLDDLTGVAIGAGPGSFTGLRIGLATAKGLCFAQSIPLWMVSSLAALALDAADHQAGTVLAVLDARKQEVFAGAFAVHTSTNPPEPLGPEQVLAPHALAELTMRLSQPVVVGTGAIAYPVHAAAAGTLLPSARATPSAKSVAHLAKMSENHSDLRIAAPRYIRLSEAELKWRTHIP